MYRIRFHGRGGQGVKTASRMLGTAFFLEGYEVQDAPRYGAERRGAPLFAYVRADKIQIFERGVIPNPDLVLVADDTFIASPAAGVMQGLDAHAVLAVNSFEDIKVWQDRLNCAAQIIKLPAFSTEDAAERPFVSSVLAGAAGRLLGLQKGNVLQAIAQELSNHSDDVISANVSKAQATYEALRKYQGRVNQRSEDVEFTPPDWITLRHEDVSRASPAIHAVATSVQVKTGLWRTLRPIVDLNLCKRCNWVCGSFCPDNAISADKNGYPVIDYDHCKGCLICLAQCPPHAIEAQPEKGDAP